MEVLKDILCLKHLPGQKDYTNTLVQLEALAFEIQHGNFSSSQAGKQFVRKEMIRILG